MSDDDARRLLRNALEMIWVQQQIVFDLMNALHAMEHLLRREYPQTFSEYELTRQETTAESYAEQRATIDEIERVMEFARKIAPPPSH